MKNELSNAGVRPPNMSALTEPEDPDCRVHAAWLAQVSEAGDGLLAKEAGGRTSVSTSSSARADRLAGQEVRLAAAHVDRRSGLITKVLIGCIFAAAIAAVFAIPSYLSFFSILTMGKRSRLRHRSRHTPHKATLIGKRAKVLEHAEGTICAGPLPTTVEMPRWGAHRSATAHRPSKDFGIGRGRQPTQLNALIRR